MSNLVSIFQYIKVVVNELGFFVSALLHRGLTLPDKRNTGQITRVSECTYLRTEEASMNSKFNTSRTLQLRWLSTADTFTIPCRYCRHDLLIQGWQRQWKTGCEIRREANVLRVTGTRLSLTGLWLDYGDLPSQSKSCASSTCRAVLSQIDE